MKEVRTRFFVDKLKEKFPTINKQSLADVSNVGLRSMADFIKAGLDVRVSPSGEGEFVFYNSALTKEEIRVRAVKSFYKAQGLRRKINERYEQRNSK